MTDLDDYDFTPTAGSNLRSLFDTSMESSDISSLHYTAPKQPKPVAITELKPNPAPKSETSVICAKVIQVWKLTNGKYNSEGKLGCAIIGSSVHNSFELILYKEKRNVIMRVKISSNFEITSKQDNFVSFYDSNKDNWLLKFNDASENKELTSLIEKYGGKIIQETNISTKKPEVTNNEETQTENKARADILTRIAKMGQSILPNNLETEEVIETKINENQIATLAKDIPHNPSASLVINQSIPTFDPFSVLVAENRAHSSEIKLNLAQISDKLNFLMNSVNGEKQGNDCENETLKSRIKVLELRTENLFKEIRDLQKENNELKLNLEKGEEISNLRKLEDEKNLEIFKLQNEISESKKQNRELLKVIETKNEEIQEFEKKLSHQDKLQETIKDLELKLKEVGENQPKDISTQDNEKSEIFKTQLKEEMNELYANLTQTNDTNIPIAKNIKQTTLKIIQHYQQLFEDFN